MFNGEVEKAHPTLQVQDFVIKESCQNFTIPVYNNSGESVKLKKGTILGTMTPLQETTEIDLHDVAAMTLEDTELDVGEIPMEAKKALFTILQSYEDDMNKHKLSPIKSLPFEHEIKVKDQTPVHTAPRRIPYSQRDEINEQISNLQAKGFIKESFSPYSSAIVPVIKPNGKIRMCIDYRALNDKTIGNTYPIPRVEDLVESLKGSQIFSVIDLKDAYWHVPIKEQDRHKTAFVLPHPWGQKWEWQVMPFGLSGAAFSLSAALGFVLKDCKEFACAYYDDIVVHSENMESHLQHLETVLNKLATYNLQVNFAKCEFVKGLVNFVGLEVTKEGVRAKQAKIEEIVCMQPPKNKDELRTFLGMAGFYRRFVDNFSKISAPLFDLLKSRVDFVWTNDCTQAFNQLKDCLSSKNLLVYPDTNKPLVIQTDASEKAIGFVLAQEEQGQLRPIQFGGRVLTDTERKYSVTDKELLAIFFAVKKCQVYVLGQDYVVYTDHKPLIYLNCFQDLISRRYRWIQYLEEMRTIIRYIPGKENVVADYFSRNVKEASFGTPIKIQALVLEAIKYSDEELLGAQMEDEDLLAVIENLQGKTVKLPKSFQAQRGKLTIDNGGMLLYNHHGNQLIVTPKELRKEILTRSHANWSAGHYGIFKTHRKILEKFWWPNLHQEVCDFIAHCSVCLEIKPQQKKSRMGLRKFPNVPLEVVSIDFLVDLPQTRRGNKHILVVNDQFSKYIQLYPIKDRTALTAARCMVDYLMKFGLPYKLFSDQDPAFESELFQCLMKELGVKKLRTTSYNPQNNGLTEQSNSVTKQYLTAFVNSDTATKPEWDCWTREAAYAYNMSTHSSTGYTPAQLMFGRKFRALIDILYGTFKSDLETPATVTAFAEKLERMYELARASMATRQQSFASYYDKRTRDDPLKVNDKVYVYLPRNKRVKLAKKWHGPFVIVEENHPVYRVAVEGHKGLEIKVFAREKLKKVPSSFVNYKEQLVMDSEIPAEEDGEEDNRFALSDTSSESEDDNTWRRGRRLRGNPAPPDRYGNYIVHFLTLN